MKFQILPPIFPAADAIPCAVARALVGKTSPGMTYTPHPPPHASHAVIKPKISSGSAPRLFCDPVPSITARPTKHNNMPPTVVNINIIILIIKLTKSSVIRYTKKKCARPVLKLPLRPSAVTITIARRKPGSFISAK